MTFYIKQEWWLLHVSYFDHNYIRETIHVLTFKRRHTLSVFYIIWYFIPITRRVIYKTFLTICYCFEFWISVEATIITGPAEFWTTKWPSALYCGYCSHACFVLHEWPPRCPLCLSKSTIMSENCKLSLSEPWTDNNMNVNFVFVVE